MSLKYQNASRNSVITTGIHDCEVNLLQANINDIESIHTSNEKKYRYLIAISDN